jgi:NitT/TauT family transport system ATP-binding protein
VSFDVLKSDRFVVLGPSGCGKSTLLKAIGGYLQPVEGEMLLNGARIGSPGPDRAFVFQEFDQLLPWKTVRDNIVFALTASGKLGKGAAVERALHFIAKVGLEKFADNFPHTLSGGMKQRVAIARAKAMEPQILLMDEPFAALDIQTRQLMENELLDLWSADRKSVVFITHDLEEAIALADRVVVLSAGPETRPIGEFVIDLPRPRDVAEIRLTPQFLALHTQIWHAMKEEVLKGYARQQRQ